MSNNVDPFVIRWPQKWINDPELQDTLRYLNRFLHDLWLRTGGGDDFIFNIGGDITALEIRVTDLEVRMDAVELRLDLVEARLDALEALTFIQITATANHTTERNEIITCTNTSSITISLNAAPNTIPAANEEVHVVRAGSLVTVSGNGKLIMGVQGGNNGVSSFNLNVKGQSVQMVFNSDTDKWHIQ